MKKFEGEEFSEHNEAETKARHEALRTVQAMKLPKKIFVSPESFIGLQGCLSNKATMILERLTEEYGDKLPALMGIALHECHYAACHAACYMVEMGYAFTVESYVRTEGWASTLSNGGLIDMEEHSEQATFRIDTPFVDRLNSEPLLECMALYWFSQASDLNQAGNPLAAQELIFEAMEASSLSFGGFMWNGASQTAKEELDDERQTQRMIRSTAGRQGAIAKNLGHQEIKKWALKEGEKLGASKVIARRLATQLPAHLSNVSRDPERLIYDALRSSAKPD